MSDLYRPLEADRGEIRILELLPGSFDSDIRSQLMYTTLKGPDSIPYEALSYVWGKPEFTEPLEFEGHQVLVTKNLATALRHLRPDAGENPRRIWVDAICINQNDVAERNHQVTIMKDIYSHCTADLAWLGPDSSSPDEPSEQVENLALGFQLLKKLIAKDNVTLLSMRNEANNYEDSDEEKDVFVLTYKEQQPLDAVLLRASLWSRVWVMQELALAPRVVLVAGFDTFDWEDISGFLSDTIYADAFHLTWSHGMLRPATQYTFERVQIVQQQRNLVRDCREGKAVSTLIDVLGRFKFADATDPRDKIYGLLGLVTEKHGVKVDYNRPWHLMFADLCAYFIESSKSLDIICQNPWTTVPLTPRDTELPTWVASFTSKDLSGLHDGFSALLFAQRGIFQAGTQTCQVPCQTLDDGTTLAAEAIILGPLGKVLQEDYETDDNNRSWFQIQSSEYFARVPRQWMELYFGQHLLSASPDPPVNYYPTSEPAFEAFWRTLVMDCKSFPIERLSQDEIDSDDKIFRKLLAFTVEEINMGHVDEWQNEYEEDKKHLYKERRDKLSELQKSLICRRMWVRNFVHWTFTVSENGLYCMLKKGTKSGDTLAVLDGGKVPVVLRAVDDGDSRRFQFIGTAYVHGFMNGEAMLAVDQGRLTRTKVLLV